MVALTAYNTNTEVPLQNCYEHQQKDRLLASRFDMIRNALVTALITAYALGTATAFAPPGVSVVLPVLQGNIAVRCPGQFNWVGGGVPATLMDVVRCRHTRCRAGPTPVTSLHPRVCTARCWTKAPAACEGKANEISHGNVVGPNDANAATRRLQEQVGPGPRRIRLLHSPPAIPGRVLAAVHQVDPPERHADPDSVCVCACVCVGAFSQRV